MLIKNRASKIILYNHLITLDIIATGCPFCNTMMTDGVMAVSEGSAQVKDIAELIAENI